MNIKRPSSREAGENSRLRVPRSFGAPQDPTLEEVSSALDEALREDSWAKAVSLIGMHWPILLEEPSHILDRALRTVPLRAFESDPRAAAVRDIRLHSSADAVDRMLGNASLPDADDLSELEGIARSDRALSLLSVSSSRMIALRVRGRMVRAMQLATLVERLGRIAIVHQPALVTSRLPAALLHVGITRGLADDLSGAVLALRDAYERAPVSRARFVERDAAGKLALFHALAGDIREARRWLPRYDSAPAVAGWYGPRVSLSADVARSLVASESLDSAAAREAVLRLEEPVNAEQNWGAAVAYARSRYALAWGDRLGAITQVRRDRERYADWLDEGSTLGPLLVQSEVDLLLATGQIRRGQQVLDRAAVHEDHPATKVARGRVALLNESPASATRHATAVLDQTVPTRIRIDALVVRIAADAQLGASVATGTQYLDDAVDESGLRLPVLALPRRARDDLRRVPQDHHRDLYPAHSTPVRLTPQQQLVLDGLQEDLSLREIAERAHLTMNTMKSHSKALYRKLNASSRDEALTRAREAGLLAHE